MLTETPCYIPSENLGSETTSYRSPTWKWVCGKEGDWPKPQNYTEMQSTHTSCLLFLLLWHICQYTSIYIILFVVLFRYFLTFKKHILGFQKQWSGQALMDLRLLTPLHMWVLICSGEMHGMGYQKDCLGRRIADFYFQTSLASSTSCFFYREHILLTWKKKLFSPPPPPPLPSKLPEGVGWLAVQPSTSNTLVSRLTGSPGAQLRGPLGFCSCYKCLGWCLAHGRQSCSAIFIKESNYWKITFYNHNVIF